MDKLDKLRAIIDRADVPSSQEVRLVIEHVLEIVRQTIIQVRKEAKTMEGGLTSEIKNVLKNLDDFKKTFSATIKDTEGKNKAQLEKVQRQILTEVNKLVEDIPKLDFIKLEQDIKKFQNELELGISKEEIRNRLESFDTETDKLRIDAIQGLAKELSDLKKTIQRMPTGGPGGARDFTRDIDLSDQLDGVSSTFNTQAMYYLLDVNLSSFPYGALRKGIDYTWTPTSITFTSEIDPSTQLASGQTLILKAILA